MIVVQILGGLGNQMFQYAAGRALAVQHGVPLFLDTSFMKRISKHDTPRNFELDVFRIHATVIKPKNLPGNILFTQDRRYGKTIRYLLYAIRYRRYKRDCIAVTSEISMIGADEFPAIHPPAYLTGYWQSERYFKQIRQVLLSDFALCNPLPSRLLKLADVIRQSASVALHIRRGDYAANPATNSVHGTCGKEYYVQAIADMKQRFPESKFFAFSDEPIWVHRNLAKLDPSMQIIERNSAHEDLYLMSQCKHHIIANSSFSWWGAWLCMNPEKTVIAPKRWYVEMSRTADICPCEWIRI
jgi:hypothetical protein